MAVESATYLSGLVPSAPAGTAPVSEGAGHLRVIKSTLQNSLPNVNEAVNCIHTRGTEPTSTSGGQLWFDNSANLLKMRNEADSGWIILDASEGARVLYVKQGTSTSSLRPASDDTYENTGMSIAPVKISATSNLYIQFNCYINTACNYATSGACNVTGYLGADDTDPATIIGGTSAYLMIQSDDVGEGTGITWDISNTFSRTFKVTAANCPDGATGTNTFNWVYKINDRDQTTITNSASWMVWEVEQ